MSNKSPKLIYLGFLSYAAAILSVVICIVFALTAAIYVPTYHLDGAFQTASGLFRLDSGQLPGRDFYPYLGVGPLLTIFPIYKIFGGDLAATVAAAKFATVFLSWIAVTTLWHFLLRPKNAIYSLVGASLILFGIYFVANQFSWPNFLAFGLDPGNSLRPVRAVIPYLLALSIYCFIKNIIHIEARNFLISAALSIALLWANDFAIPTFGLFFLFIFIYFYCFDKNWACNTLIIAIASITIWIVLLFFVTAGHSLELLKYNFFDVAKDQWWYFAPYESHSRIFEISQISRLFTSEIYFSLFVLFAVLLLAIKTKLIEYYLVFFIGLTLFAGGCLASIGGHLGGYFGGFYFWGAATALIFCLKFLVILGNYNKWFSFFHPQWAGVLGFLMISLMLVGGLRNYTEKLSLAKLDQKKFYVDDFGAFLDIDFREYIDYLHKNREKVVVEDYWGLANSLHRRFPPWPVDAVIHALGNVRDISRGTLKQAELIITTRYSTSPDWLPWSLSQNYWFYDELISNWEPAFMSPTTLVWKRGHERSAFVGVACHVSADKNSFTLPQSAPGFYRIKLGYSSAGGGRHLLMVRNNISFASDADGFLSLKPGANMVTFPVLKLQNDLYAFNLKVIGKARAEISSCIAERILYEHDELLHVEKPNDFFITDENWVNGISRYWAGFFTRNTEENRAYFKMGSTVIFENGDTRSVISTMEAGRYLNIWVDGEILNPESAGFPSEYRVLQ